MTKLINVNGKSLDTYSMGRMEEMEGVVEGMRVVAAKIRKYYLLTALKQDSIVVKCNQSHVDIF